MQRRTGGRGGGRLPWTAVAAGVAAISLALLGASGGTGAALEMSTPTSVTPVTPRPTSPPTAPPETAPPETAPPETAPPETAPPYTTPPVTAPPVTASTPTEPSRTAPVRTGPATTAARGTAGAVPTGPVATSPYVTLPYSAPTGTVGSPYSAATGTVAQAPPATASVPGGPTTTSTTLPSILGHLPATPVTLPFVTKAQNAHVDPDLAKISLGGFALALLIMVVQFALTRPGRRGSRTL